MAINGRTFQILYILRSLATDRMESLLDDGDKGSTLDEVAGFIAARRKLAPTIYDTAYIAPSALEQMAGRMTTGDGLLVRVGKRFTLTIKGSAMADLLTDMDACTVIFQESYKAEICHAVLRQRRRIGQEAPVSPREVAATAYISLDSARRGLTNLFNDDKILEDRSGRSPMYSLPPAAVVETDDVPVIKIITADPAEDDFVTSVLADIDNDDMAPGDSNLQPQAPLDDGDEIVGRILGEKTEETLDPPTPLFPDFKHGADDELMVDPDAEVESHDPAFDKSAGNPVDAAWNDVPFASREAIYHQAMATGLDFNKFIDVLNRTNQDRIQRGLFRIGG